ncbi:ABC transporter substrate-binding protein [Alicyclobacillus sp. SO9]|uniref:ABC transporter substrate-binding protein n=1 Tax=Alicyclobacillus sp. SO9 TaxID=2665646 RepID=UPI0018E86498|nr:sugar ABC transporter substrate-binding protein [Alicyclobacillus sp. SO9]QQE77962.1 sugar ABC transporter substrate-binding protein [Alicyclobacillus sp. SO9]
MRTNTGIGILAVLSATAVLGGCGSAAQSHQGNTASNSGKHITLEWGFGGNAAGIKAMKQVAKLYEQTHPNVTVKMITDAPGAFLTKLPAMFKSNSAPDVINLSNGWVPNIQDTFHALLNLNPYLSKDGVKKSDYQSNSWKDETIGGKLYALPNQGYGDGIAYNETLFKKYNVPLPKPGWTTQDFVRDAKMLTHGSGQKKTWGISEAVYARNLPQLFGGNLIDYSTKKVQATSSKVEKAVNFEINLIKQGVMPKNLVYGKSVDPFFTGQAGMDMFYVEYFQSEYDSQIGSKFKWNVAPFPVGWKGVTQLGANAVWKNSKHKDAAVKFTIWLAQNPKAMKLEESGGSPLYLPLLKKFESSPPTAFKNIDVKNPVSMISRSVFVDQTGTYGQIWRNWLQIMGKVQTTGKVASNLSQFQKQSQTLLSQSGNSSN